MGAALRRSEEVGLHPVLDVSPFAPSALQHRSSARTLEKLVRGRVITMTCCPYSCDCHFFAAEVGYSPQMYATMKSHFCLTDNSDCARLLAMRLVGRDNVPAALLPTDRDRARALAIH